MQGRETSKLEGESFFGGLDSKGTKLALGDYENGVVDVYSYSASKGAKYLYSFSNGLTQSDMVETGQFAPDIKKHNPGAARALQRNVNGTAGAVPFRLLKKEALADSRSAALTTTIAGGEPFVHTITSGQ